MAAGLSKVDIYAKLFGSEATVKTHINRDLAKLELTRRVRAVVAAYAAWSARANRTSATGTRRRTGSAARPWSEPG
jgi:hypothetical protein